MYRDINNWQGMVFRCGDWQYYGTDGNEKRAARLALAILLPFFYVPYPAPCGFLIPPPLPQNIVPNQKAGVTAQCFCCAGSWRALRFANVVPCGCYDVLRQKMCAFFAQIIFCS
ncbi:hypothetical protein D3Z51_16355 [Clostridiaceae bacterium]|nr:hypothetical protein [Clostridiaceae bacterium]RKI10431.1 hypothetical protein D7V81_15820 [bacterium 1XD21-70]